MVALARSVAVLPDRDRLTHIEAAEMVLQQAQRPLTAKEIAHRVSAEALTAISGKTPWKTITARLSQDIVDRGSASRFMRTFHGRFALRGWDFEPEFEVPKRVVHPLDETIKVIPRAHFNFIMTAMARGEADPLDYSSFLQASIAMGRRDAEVTLDVVQLIPTFVISRDNHYLTYKRTKRLPEARLHHAVCVNFGGHMQVEDAPVLFMDDEAVVERFLQRELHEELAFSDPPLSIKPEGVLYLQGSDFEKQHVGLCFSVHLSHETEVESLEPGMHTDLRFVSREALQQSTTEFGLLVKDFDRQSLMPIAPLISDLDRASIVNNLASSLIWSLPLWSWALARFAYPRLSRFFKMGMALKLALSLLCVGVVLTVSINADDRWKAVAALAAIAVFAGTILRPFLVAGLFDAFTTTEGGITYESSLRLAKRSIDFLGIGAAKLTALPEFSKAVERCASAGGEIRLLLSPPNNPLLETMARRNGVPLATYQQNVRDSLRLLAHLKVARGLNISVRFYPAVNLRDNQQFRLMFIDKKMCLLSWTVWGSHIGRKNPQIVLKANEKSPSNSMYLAFETHFDELWGELADVDLTQFE